MRAFCLGIEYAAAPSTTLRVVSLPHRRERIAD